MANTQSVFKRLQSQIQSSIRDRKRRQRSGSLAHSRKRRRRLFAQSLEDRRVLAAFTVITPGDAGAGTCTTSACTLRDAVIEANNSPGEDTISFDASVTGTITTVPANGEIEITETVTITGPGASSLTVDANASVANQFRVFNVTDLDADVTIEGLTISGGRNDSNTGGAIRFGSDGTLTVRDSVITGNQANNGGAIYSEYQGTVQIENSDLTNNSATYGVGGAIHNVSGNTIITGGNVTSNSAYASGGAIASPYQGSVTLTNTNVSDNDIGTDGYSGGAIYSGEGDITITGSTISGNTSTGDGGAIYSIDGMLQVENSTFEMNEASYNGGAIFNELGDISLSGTTINQNTSLYGDGAGISTIAGSTTITGSTISNNQSVTDGGGLSNVRGQVIIRDSTFSGNTSGSDGGGIATISGDLTITNSTVSGNSANVRGGGIQTDSAALRIVNSTVVGNSANISGGGVGTLIGFLSDDPDSQLFIHNTIIAQNTSAMAPDLSSPRDPVANLEVLSSLIGDNSDSTLTASATPDANGNLIGTSTAPINPGLGMLAANGGPVETHEPISTSVVIDAGDNSLALDFGPDGAPGGGDDTTLDTDGRGGLFIRIANGGAGAATVDMGAVEIQPRPVLTVDSLEDENDGDFSPGDRSLREILTLANADLGFDTILFAGGLAGTITIDNALGALPITDSVSIIGPGADSLTITGAADATSRLIDISASATDVSLAGMLLTGGNAGTGDGGAIRSAAPGDLTLRQVEISGNSAAQGGGVSIVDGTLAIAGSTIAENSSTSHGGGVHVSGTASSLTAVNATIADNSADGSGGGIYADIGSVTVSSSTVSGNTAVGQTGGIWVSGTSAQNVNIGNSIVAGNTGGSAADLIEMGSVTLVANDSFIGSNDGTSLEASPSSASGPAKNSSNSFVGTAAEPLDPLLDAIGNNGGQVRTIAPQSTSLVLDAGSQGNLPLDQFDLDGDNNTNELLPVDARGAQRVSSGLDMGAVELPPAPSLTWAAPDPIVFGTGLDDTQLNAVSNVAGSFEYTPPAGTILDAGADQILTAIFTPDNPLASRGGTITVLITVEKADPVLTWSDPDAITFGTALDDTQLNATADVDGTFVYDPAAAAILDAGTQTLSVTFTPTDSDNLNEATATVSIVVDQAVPTITWDEPAGIIQGTALGNDQLNATSDVAGTFSYVPAAGTVLNVGEDQTLTAVFTPDDSNFAETTVTTTIDVISGAEFDFGDAPSSYPVTLADDGARHEVSNLRLGVDVDSESDGTPSSAADADGADDDGVIFLTTLIVPDAGQPVIAATTVNASQDGSLDAWIDFNGDGDWDDVDEQIATSTALTAGDNHIAFNVPSDAVAGSTFARFRISTAGGLSPTGAAADGEVEDYVVEIVAGNGVNDVVVDHNRERITIEAQNDVISVGAAGSLDTFYNGSVNEASRVIVNANDVDNEFLLSPISPLPALRVDGGDGTDQITVTQASADFTSDDLQAVSIEVVALSGTDAQEISLDDDAVSAITSDGTLTIIGGEGDTLNLIDADGWSIGDSSVIDGRFAVEIVHGTSSNVILSSLAAEWQNPASPSDVNGNGEVTAGDALLIINELGRRTYSDDTSQVLDPASSADPFPGFFYDQNADGRATALDALRVINELARNSNSGGGEQFPGEGEWASLVDALIEAASEEEREQIERLQVTSNRIFSFGSAGDEDRAGDVIEKLLNNQESETSDQDAVDELMNDIGSLI